MRLSILKYVLVSVLLFFGKNCLADYEQLIIDRAVDELQKAIDEMQKDPCYYFDPLVYMGSRPVSLYKTSYPAEKLDVQTDVTISENGRIDYKNRYSNGNKWMSYHVLTAIVLKDEKDNIFHVIYEKKGLNAGYLKTEIQVSHGIDQINPRLVSKIDVAKSVIAHDRVDADALVPKILPEVFTYAKMLISTSCSN